MIRDVVFDLDGTLVDSAAQCEAIILAMRAERGHDDPLPPELTRQYSGIAGPVMVPALLGTAADDPGQDLVEFRTRYHALKTPESALYDGVIVGLDRLLAHGLRLSICSAKPQSLCERVLEDTGILHKFSAIVGGDRARICKPDPAHFDDVIALMGGKRESAIYIGDSEVDFMLAEQARIPFIFASYGYAQRGHGIESARHGGNFPQIIEHILTLSN